MKIYFSPLACSLATRIILEETGLDAEFIHVQPGRPLPDGRDYACISPLGYVPAMETDAGKALTEGVVILQHLADLSGNERLAGAPGSERRLDVQAWLNFIATELHKTVFSPVMSDKSPEGAREWARHQAVSRFDYLESRLEDRAYLLDDFTIADAYLLAILNWCEHAGYDMTPWPGLMAWRGRIRQRPSVARALATELPLLNAA